MSGQVKKERKKTKKQIDRQSPYSSKNPSEHWRTTRLRSYKRPLSSFQRESEYGRWKFTFSTALRKKILRPNRYLSVTKQIIHAKKNSQSWLDPERFPHTNPSLLFFSLHGVRQVCLRGRQLVLCVSEQQLFDLWQSVGGRFWSVAAPTVLNICTSCSNCNADNNLTVKNLFNWRGLLSLWSVSVQSAGQ